MKKMDEKFNPIKYQNDYIRKTYDRVNLLLPKGQKEILKVRAQERGESLNQFVCTCIDEYLNKNRP